MVSVILPIQEASHMNPGKVVSKVAELVDENCYFFFISFDYVEYYLYIITVYFVYYALNFNFVVLFVTQSLIKRKQE